MAHQESVLNGAARNGLRFYGRRKGRPLKKSMKRLLDENLPKFAFDPAISLNTQFGRHVDCYLEIGFGGGEHLAGLAAAMPESDFIGAEPFVNGVASLLRYIHEQHLGNIRIWPNDVRLILSEIGTASLAGAYIMFPDPWPKRRHAGRRILQPAVLDQLAKMIRPGGSLVLASDDPTAKSWLLQAMMLHFGFVWTARRPADWRQRPTDFPATRYMKKADQAARKSSWFHFRRCTG